MVNGFYRTIADAKNRGWGMLNVPCERVVVGPNGVVDYATVTHTWQHLLNVMLWYGQLNFEISKTMAKTGFVGYCRTINALLREMDAGSIKIYRTTHAGAEEFWTTAENLWKEVLRFEG